MTPLPSGNPTKSFAAPLNRLLPRACAVATLVAALVGAGGCVSLSREHPERIEYIVEAPREAAVPVAGEPMADTLVVRPFRVSPLHDSQNFVIRRANGEISRDYYHSFAIPVGRMIQQRSEQWLTAGQKFRHVVGTSSLAVEGYALEGNVVRIDADYSGEVPQAVVEVQYTLFALEDPQPVVLFQKTFKEVRGVKEKTGPGVVSAWESALSSVLGRLELEIGGAVLKHPVKPRAAAPAKAQE